MIGVEKKERALPLPFQLSALPLPPCIKFPRLAQASAGSERDPA